MQPETSKPIFSITWRRAFVEEIEGEPIVTRVDMLHDGPADHRPSIPARIWLLRDFRRVKDILVPHEMCSYVLLKRRVRGEITKVSDIAINDEVTFPDKLHIPANTSVNDLTSGRRYRIGIDGEMQDGRISQSVDQMKAGATFDHRSKVRYWLIAVNIFIVAILFAMWVRKGRSKVR